MENWHHVRPPSFLEELVMSKVTAFSPHSKSLTDMAETENISAPYAQYFMSCGKRRKMVHTSCGRTGGTSVTCTGLGIR